MERYTNAPTSSNKEYLELTPELMNISSNVTDSSGTIIYNEKARLVIAATFPIIFIVGTVGNVLTFIIMQKGSLKHSSTCFYMAMLAMADTCEYS